MTTDVSQIHEKSRSDVVAQRCRELGLTPGACGLDGRIGPAVSAGHDAADAIVDALLRTPIVASALERQASDWREQPGPQAAELFEGFWVIPLPVMERRRRMGYRLAIALGPECFDAEQFTAACQAALLDVEAAAAALRSRARFTASEVGLLASSLTWVQQDQAELASDEEAVAEFSQQLTEAYEELTLLYKLGQSMNELVQPRKFVRLVCDELYATLGFQWIAAWFSESRIERTRLRGETVASGEIPFDASHLARRISALCADANPSEPIVLNASDARAAGLSRDGAQVLVHPLAREGRILGAIVAGEKFGGAEINSVDMKLVDAAGANLRIFLQNAALYDEQQSMFVGTLRALTSAIDAKDRYTSGHSERVAHLASRLAEAAGLDQATIERVHISGLVHDVGKIGVPETVLCKTGRLTDEEFDIIKTHPEIGRNILKDIPQLDDVLPAVMHHHERWDGRGYPHGIAGEAIPFFARLVGLADAFDAMSSTRTYRAALPRAQVIDEIHRCAGAQFDPDLAPKFIALDFSEYDAMVAKHLERELRQTGREEAA